MRYLKGTLYAFLAQESGQIQLLIIAPIVALSFLSLIVRTASSAVDPAVERKKVTEQLKRRLTEVQQEAELPPSHEIILPVGSETASFRIRYQTQEEPEFSPKHLPLREELQIPAGPQSVLHRVKKGETFESILRGKGLHSEETTKWVRAARKVKGLKGLRAGRVLTLSFSETTGERTLISVSYEIDKKTLLLLEKAADGTIVSRRETLPTVLVWRAVGGRIQSNLYNAAKQAGVPRRLLDDLADMDWDIDLSSDLHPGDIIKVIFEEFQHQGKAIEHGKILAAEIISRGKARTLFSITGTGKREEGGFSSAEAASRQFLRYPLKFSRISSVFTTGRFHPLLKRSRPHLGVDFAAPAGTPVRSVAHGKVLHAGRLGGYGNFVRIDHPGPYASAYAHLQRIAKGVKVGASVERGQVIGYVGSTGLATGPHLHFELFKDGKYINPLTAKLPAVTESPQEKKQKQFITEAKKYLGEQLAALQVDNQPVTFVRVSPFRDKALQNAESSPRESQRLAFRATQSSAQRKSSAARKPQSREGRIQRRSSGRR